MSGDVVDRLRARESALAVIGLGYVGLPLAVSLGRVFDVIGYDVSQEKIDAYTHGVDLTNDVGHEALANSQVKFTTDEEYLQAAEFYIVAVPTPVSGDKRPDLRAVRGACETVGRYLNPGDTVVFESTVYPGATEDVCVPILERASGLKYVQDFKVGYSPERINPGDRTHTLQSVVKVVSGCDEEALRAIRRVYDTVVEAGTFAASSIRVAEAIKVVENAQRDINIAFMNELAMAFDKMAIDSNEVVDGMNTKWNALGFRPGLVGGHCIGVDPYYFTYRAEMLGLHSQLILAGRRTNDGMGTYVAEKVVKYLVEAGASPKKSRVAILGLTFKEDCPDVRNSRVLDIVTRLNEFGIRPIVADPWLVADFRVPDTLEMDLVDMDEVHACDCVVFAVAHRAFKEWDDEHCSRLLGGTQAEVPIVIDVKGAMRGRSQAFGAHEYWSL